VSGSGASPDVLLAFQAAMRAKRKAAGLTHKDMAPTLNFSRQRLGQIENLRWVPTLVTADRIAAFFGDSLTDFLAFGNVTLAQSD
jgi:DNA-binding XRE family transcriptional regulator